MPTFDCGTSGLTGTVGCTILDSAGSVHVARTTAAISEPIAGSGVYFTAEHDATATLTYVWDKGAGAISGSETLYAGRGVAQTGDAYARLGAPSGASVSADNLLLIKGRFNKVISDPVTGHEIVYDDNSTTPLKTGDIYEDIAGTMPFDGSGANRRDRMT